MSPPPLTPTLNLPSPSPPPPSALELPSELLLSLHQALDRDALDSFVISQAGGAGAVQLEDVLNELVPDGESGVQAEARAWAGLGLGLGARALS